VRERVTLVDGHGERDTITVVKGDASGTARGVLGEHSLDGDVHGGLQTHTDTKLDQTTHTRRRAFSTRDIGPVPECVRKIRSVSARSQRYFNFVHTVTTE